MWPPLAGRAVLPVRDIALPPPPSACQDSSVAGPNRGRETWRGLMDPKANERFTRLYTAHYLAVLAYCARRVNRSEAEDITNETFAVFWRKMDRFDPDSPLPWLYRVALGLIKNRRRATRRTVALVSKLGGIGKRTEDAVDVVVVRRERDGEVLEALGRLSTADQEVLRLSIWEELPAADIGLVLGCSTSAAEQRLHRAKKRLARKLSPVLSRSVPSPQSLEEGGRP